MIALAYLSLQLVHDYGRARCWLECFACSGLGVNHQPVDSKIGIGGRKRLYLKSDEIQKMLSRA